MAVHLFMTMTFYHPYGYVHFECVALPLENTYHSLNIYCFYLTIEVFVSEHLPSVDVRLGNVKQ